MQGWVYICFYMYGDRGQSDSIYIEPKVSLYSLSLGRERLAMYDNYCIDTTTAQVAGSLSLLWWRIVYAICTILLTWTAADILSILHKDKMSRG